MNVLSCNQGINTKKKHEHVTKNMMHVVYTGGYSKINNMEKIKIKNHIL